MKKIYKHFYPTFFKLHEKYIRLPEINWRFNLEITDISEKCSYQFKYEKIYIEDSALLIFSIKNSGGLINLRCVLINACTVKPLASRISSQNSW